MGSQFSDIRIDKVDLLAEPVSMRLEHLFNELESKHPQLGLDWLRNLCRYARDDIDSAYIFVASDKDNGIVALPLNISSQREGRALGNFYTSLFEPASSTEYPLPMLIALLSHLRVNEGLSMLTLAPLDRDGALFKPLLDAFKVAGWSGTHTFFCFGNWTEPVLDNNWESYLKQRPSKLRSTLERKSRALFREGKGDLKIIKGGDELLTATGDYTSIYEASWKKNEPYPEFMPRLIQLAADKGWLRLGIATYEGTAIAAQIWLVANGTAYIFKLAYRPEFAHFSPGTLLTAHLMQHALEQDEVQAVDYLSGDDAYKQDWMSLRRERHGIAGYNRQRLRGLTKLMVHQFSRCMRRLGLRRQAPDPAS